MQFTETEVTIFAWTLRAAAGVAIGYISAMNDWQLTSLKENTYKFIVSGRGNLVRIIGNVKDSHLDENWNVQPGYKPGNLFVRTLHHAGIWRVSPFFPIVRVLSFKIQKARLISQPKKGGTILDRIEFDQEPSVVNELEAFIQRPIPVMEAETEEGFKPNVLMMIMLRINNPKTVVLEVGSERFFALLYSAVSGAIGNYVRSRPHDEFVKEDRGPTSAIALAVKRLNEPSEPAGPSGSSARPADPTTSSKGLTAEEVKSRGIKKTLGVEITEAWVEGIDPDSTAAEAVEEVFKSQQAAKKRAIDAQADRDAKVKQAEGDTAKTERLVKIYGDPQLACKERVAELQGPNIRYLSNNYGSGSGGGVPSVVVTDGDDAPKK